MPPRLYGGTERVIAWLTEELIGLGHEVTLFASGDSQTRATLVPVWPRAVRFGRPRLNTIIAQTALVETVARRAPDFDVIHWHTDWLHLPLCSRLKVPSVTTYMVAWICRACRKLSGIFRTRHSSRFRIASVPPLET